MGQHTQESGVEQGGERQIVAMRLADEVFGIDIAHIHTVITPQAITMVPNTPSHVMGVMNMRGQILPVIDLRLRFGIEPRAPGAGSSKIVIVDVDGISAGLVVDSVLEVLRLPESDIEPPSKLLAFEALSYVSGIGRIPLQGKPGAGCFILVLDTIKVLMVKPEDALSLNAQGQAA